MGRRVHTFRRLSPDLALLAAASAIPLLFDRSRRRTAGDKTIRMAFLQFASPPTSNEGVTDIVAGLEEKGFREGNTRSLSGYRAGSDLFTASTMAGDMTDSHYDLIITVHSSSTQAVANADKQGRTTSVFGIDSGLAASGVGIGWPSPIVLPVCLESEPLNPSMPFLVWPGLCNRATETRGHMDTLKGFQEPCGGTGEEMPPARRPSGPVR